MIPFLISILIALGVYFLTRFIGKRITDFHDFSYLGFAIISFMWAFILHDKINTAILSKLPTYPFLDRRTIILLAIVLGLIGISTILRIEGRRKIDTNKSIGVEMNYLSSWIYFNRLMERWKLSRIELHEKILNSELRGKRHVDYTDYASSQETPYIIPIEKIKTEFDIIDDKLCFKRKDIEEFEKKHGKVTFT